MGRHDGQEYWTLPGGGTEPGQSPEDAVIREVAEGTGPEEAVLAPRAPYLGTTSELAPRYVVEGDGLHLASWLMSTSRMPAPAPGTTAPPSSGSRRFVGRLCAAVTLLPRGILAVGAAAAGRADAGRAFLGAGTGSGGRMESTRPGGARVTGHAVLTVLMGALSLVLAALFVLAVARGALYGFVGQGPYDTSWGGPSRAGAWLVHFRRRYARRLRGVGRDVRHRGSAEADDSAPARRARSPLGAADGSRVRAGRDSVRHRFRPAAALTPPWRTEPLRTSPLGLRGRTGGARRASGGTVER
ncbi:MULTISPECIES: NUDIX domain-containing protein [Streptomyces]|uniref:NUDIX domain-containing protein n=1 Tax=Streptomyces flavovirens TaxID=52258 RepID=A0ABV8MXS6_9ACTN|nr:NUDIX domain-containing protein [Streptomyces sp. MBT51]